MFQALFSGLLLEFIGIFIRWVTLYLIYSLKGKEPKSFNFIKNRYRELSADSVAYNFGNRIIGITFIMAVILIILELESCN